MSESITKIEKEEKARPTPWPWEVVQAEPDWPLYIRQPAQKLVIATVHGLPNAQANANLIAAAPALLAQAEMCLRWMIAERDCYYEGCVNPGSGYVHDADDRTVLDRLDRDIDELRAVIEKAGGVI